MKKSHLAEVLEDLEYHVNERPYLMEVYKHGNFVCTIKRDELTGAYHRHWSLPETIRKAVNKYGDI